MNLHLFIILIGSVSLASTFILTTFSFIIRMVGAINNINAKSWNLASAITIFNSFFIAIALASIAFFLDNYPSLFLLNKIFLFSTFIVLVGHIYMFSKIDQICILIKKITDIYFNKGLLHSFIEKKLNKLSYDFFSFFAWLFFLIGFIFPTFLAIIFNEYRTTLFQLSFVFNSLGTFITIVITDRRASLLSDKSIIMNNDKKQIADFLSIVIINRIYASLIIFLTLIILYFLF